jgi:hypothetical protein
MMGFSFEAVSLARHVWTKLLWQTTHKQMIAIITTHREIRGARVYVFCGLYGFAMCSSSCKRAMGSQPMMDFWFVGLAKLRSGSSLADAFASMVTRFLLRRRCEMTSQNLICLKSCSQDCLIFKLSVTVYECPCRRTKSGKNVRVGKQKKDVKR